MNILMICTEKLPVPNIRGGAIQTYICGALPMLSKRHNITVLGRTDPELPEDQVVDGIRYVRVDSAGQFDIYTKRVTEFLAQNHDYHMIHIFNRPKLVLPVRQHVPGARIILSMHNDMFEPKKISQEEGNAVIEQTERIITISNYIGDAICQLFPQAKTKVRTIYSGVDLSRFAPWTESKSSLQARESLREKYKISNKKVILFVGRLSRNKGPHVLIRAMEHIKSSSAVLVIVGGSWFSDDTISDYVAYVRALAEHSPVPVITTGYVQAHEVHRWFCAGDVFVCTSIWQEPLARVHYEAMAAGLPFITTNRGGNSEIVKNNNGVLISNPEDPLEYAQHLNTMLSNLPDARQMGLNGRRMVEEHFTWNRVAEDILSVWEQR